MQTKKKIAVLGLALMLATGTLSSNAVVVSDCGGTSKFNVVGFTLNPQFIIAIVNKVKDNPNGFTSLPADSQELNSVVQLTVNNVSGAPQTLEFAIKVSDQSVGLILDMAQANDYIISKTTLPPGISTITYGSVQQKGNWSSVSVNQQFIDEVKNNFKDPSQLSQAVQTLGTHVFNISVQLYDSETDAPLPSCGTYVTTYPTNFTLFSQPSTTTTNVPTLIYPTNNGSIFTPLPNFIWTAAGASNVNSSSIKYRLEVTKDSPSGDIVRVDIPAGQLFYQWQASDPAFAVSTKYYWRVLGLDSTGNPIGGTNDSGWVVTNEFQVQSPTGATGVTLGDVDGVVQKSLVGSPDLLKILSSMKISAVLQPGSLSDDIYTQLKSGQATVTSASVSTH